MADEIRLAKLNAARIEEEAAANTRSEMRDLTLMTHHPKQAHFLARQRRWDSVP